MSKRKMGNRLPWETYPDYTILDKDFVNFVLKHIFFILIINRVIALGTLYLIIGNFGLQLNNELLLTDNYQSNMNLQI